MVCAGAGRLCDSVGREWGGGGKPCGEQSEGKASCTPGLVFGGIGPGFGVGDLHGDVEIYCEFV